MGLTDDDINSENELERDEKTKCKTDNVYYYDGDNNNSIDSEEGTNNKHLLDDYIEINNGWKCPDSGPRNTRENSNKVYVVTIIVMHILIHQNFHLHKEIFVMYFIQQIVVVQ